MDPFYNSADFTMSFMSYFDGHAHEDDGEGESSTKRYGGERGLSQVEYTWLQLTFKKTGFLSIALPFTV